MVFMPVGFMRARLERVLCMTFRLNSCSIPVSRCLHRGVLHPSLLQPQEGTKRSRTSNVLGTPRRRRWQRGSQSSP